MEDARSRGADWYLGDAEEQHRSHPKSFFIPSRYERGALTVGAIARLLFFVDPPIEGKARAERMWVEVDSVTGANYVGLLMNTPIAIADLRQGDAIAFGPEHVVGLNDKRWAPYEGFCAFVSRRLLEDEGLVPGFICHEPEDAELTPHRNGDRPSGWQLLVGDETEQELADVANVRCPKLAWVMKRYPAFGELVFSGVGNGRWVYDPASGDYRPEG